MLYLPLSCIFSFVFFSYPPPTEIYTLSLHDALPIFRAGPRDRPRHCAPAARWWRRRHARHGRSEEHTSELQSRENLVCRLLLEKKKKGATKKLDQTTRTHETSLQEHL